MPAEGGSTSTTPERMAATPQRALELLKKGNRRWVEGRLNHPNRSTERREQLAQAQYPFATVFSCIDSRVPAEIVFDCGIGDLVVVRSGAHVLDQGVVLGSLQFGADRLHTPLVLVLGHQACGAVQAAIDALERDQQAPIGLRSIIQAIRPAYELARENEGDIVEQTVRTHTRLTVQAIRAAPLIDRLADGDTVAVVGGYYSLDTGAVSFLD